MKKNIVIFDLKKKTYMKAQKRKRKNRERRRRSVGE